MKLSEAIRLGGMATRQIEGDFFQFGWGCHSIVGTCALGAALLAIGEGKFANLTQGFDVLRRTYPWIADVEYEGPDGYRSSVMGIIWRLNDRQHWSREQIADWVKGLEQAQEAVAEPELVEAHG